MIYKSIWFVLPFILNLNPLFTPTNSPLGIRPHVPRPGEIPRWLQLRRADGWRRVEEKGWPQVSPSLLQDIHLWERGVWDEAPQLLKMVGARFWGERRGMGLPGKPSRAQPIPASITYRHPPPPPPPNSSALKHCLNRKYSPRQDPLKTKSPPKHTNEIAPLKAPNHCWGFVFWSASWDHIS